MWQTTESISGTCWLLPKFIKNFAHRAKWLTTLTHHDAEFAWTSSPLTTFNTLKKCIVGSTYPSLPRPFQALQMTPVELSCLKNMIVKNFQLHSSCTHLQHQTEMEHHKTRSLWHLLCRDQVELLSPGIWHCYPQWPQASKKFLNGKNTNGKVHRWSLELATCSITFEWISGAHNKAADCLSWLVDVKNTPETPTALISMLVTSTPDDPATHGHSKTCNTANTTPADSYKHTN